MRKFLLFSTLIVFCIRMNSNELSGKKYYDYFPRIEFQKDKIKLEGFEFQYEEDSYNGTFKYNILKKGYFTFLEISFRDKKEYWLALQADDYLIIYNDKYLEPVFFGCIKLNDPAPSSPFYYPYAVKATSFFSGTIYKYPPENLIDPGMESVWIEGAEGYGIGEKIFLSRSEYRTLIILNGYISYNKPHVYEQYSRIKKLKAYDNASGKEIIVELKDTPNPQKILTGELKNREITLEIIDVYKGTKFDNACVSLIVYSNF